MAINSLLQDAKTTMDAAPGMVTVTGAVGDAGTMFRTGASGVTGEQMAQYMNPYQQAVFDEINESFDTQSAQAGLRAAQAGAFGRSRAGTADRNR